MTYRNAPITEAVIDIRVEPDAGLGIEKLEEFAESLKDRFPEIKTQEQMMLEASMQEGVDPKAVRSKTGKHMHNPAEGKIVQAQLTGYTFSKLAPYEDWETFRNEAQLIWRKYRDSVQPRAVSRIAVRYINRLDLPLPFKDFKEYLGTVPEIASGLPQTLSAYFLQVQIPYEDITSLLILNTTIVDPVREGVCSVVLDFDLFRTHEIAQGDDKLWEQFEVLRIKKNEAFEACITDATRDLFK